MGYLVPLKHDDADTGLRRRVQSLVRACVLDDGLPTVTAGGSQRGVSAAGAAARAWLGVGLG